MRQVDGGGGEPERLGQRVPAHAEAELGQPPEQARQQGERDAYTRREAGSQRQRIEEDWSADEHSEVEAAERLEGAAREPEAEAVIECESECAEQRGAAERGQQGSDRFHARSMAPLAIPRVLIEHSAAAEGLG